MSIFQTVAIAQPQQPTELVIEPGRTEQNYWQDLWRYRELFLILAWRDITVRYKQTIIGIAWAVLRPFLTMLVFTVIFGGIAKLPSEGNAPYALLVFAGTLPWSLFATALGEASNSLIGNERLISKVYFPRLIIPSATVVTAFVDFLISLGVLALMMLFIQLPTPRFALRRMQGALCRGTCWRALPCWRLLHMRVMCR